jgi:hypothetical protein
MWFSNDLEKDKVFRTNRDIRCLNVLLMLRTHRSVRSGDLGTWGLGDEAISKTEGSPRHPVTPSQQLD